MERLRAAGRSCRTWWRDTTDPMLLTSPFLERQSLPKILNIYNIYWAVDHWLYVHWDGRCKDQDRTVANVRLGLAILILALLLFWPSIYRVHALKVEAASALLMCAAMDQLCRHGVPEHVPTWRLYWRVQLMLLMTLKLHPLSLSVAVAFQMWGSLATFPEDFLMNRSWHEPGLLANESLQRFLVLCAYPAAIWCWYLFSFTSKIYAIKTGQVVPESGHTSFRERAEQLLLDEGQSSFWRWWTRSMHECVTDSPLSSRNIPAAIICCIILWGSHMVYVDVAVRFVQTPASGTCHVVPAMLQQDLSHGALSLLVIVMTGFITSFLRRVGFLGYALTKDLPLLACALAPSAMSFALHVWMLNNTCLHSLPAFAIFSAPIAGVGLVEALFVLSLSHVHPTVMCVAVILCCIYLSWLEGMIPGWRLHPATLYQFMIGEVLLLILHSWGHASVVRTVWAAVERSQANAQSMEQLRSWNRDEDRERRSWMQLVQLQSEGPAETKPMPARSLASIAEELKMSMASSSSPTDEAGQDLPALHLEVEGAETAYRPQASVAVLRHGERQDAVFDSGWHQTEDAAKYPGDCPITDEGVRTAREVARTLRDFGDYGIVVSSPYLRCVQTAVAIADELDLVVLLDQELGEVFGPDIFGELGARPRAWRSRHELHKALEAWEPKLEKSFSTAPARRVCWQRVLGSAPKWGERIPAARQRYARRFLRYLSRSRRGNKNLIVVSHGIMVQTCMKVLPSTSVWDVGSIPYCSGLMAHFWQKQSFTSQDSVTPKTFQDQFSFMITEADMMAPTHAADAETPVLEHTPLSTDLSAEAEEESQLRHARLQWWEVHVVGADVQYDVPSPRSRTRSRNRYQDYLDSIRSDHFSWENLYSLLGDLPDEVPLDAFQTAAVRNDSLDLSSDSGTRSSMEMFRRPRITSLQTESVGTTDDPGTEPISPVTPPAPMPVLNLKASSLMGRRGRVLNLNTGAPQVPP
ncbi:unnamed protein product [Symbiodinium sp. CCMP2592]|nr:unnamed protein product [Symbiodinium sp. CCMP2592]